MKIPSKAVMSSSDSVAMFVLAWNDVYLVGCRPEQTETTVRDQTDLIG